MPMDVRVTTMLEPPALMKGSALPVKGINPTITAMFIKASRPIQVVRPKASKAPNWSWAFLAMTKPRQMRRANKSSKKKPPMIPVS